MLIARPLDVADTVAVDAVDVDGDSGYQRKMKAATCNI